MELDKKDICKIIDGEPKRIEHVKLIKYSEEEYAEAAYRVKIDNAETKYCWCSICKQIYSADKKHLMGNIRTHWNGHRSRKRPNCIYEVYSQFRKFVSDANVAKKRNGTSYTHFNDFVRDNKSPSNSEKFEVGQLLFDNWKDQSEAMKNEWLDSWNEFPFIQPISTTRFGSIFYAMETYLKNIPLIQKIKMDEEFHDESGLIQI